MKISAILLAAGAGSRFGGDKLVHPLHDGTPLGVAAARNLLAAVPDVVAVVRSGDVVLAGLLEREGCNVSFCADAGQGMGVSLAHGIGCRRDADAWIVALADMPAIRSVTIAAVARALEAGRSLVAPSYQGRRGHPVGFGKHFGGQLGALRSDAGAREIIASNRDDITLIECNDGGVLRDIDRREDLGHGG